MLSYGVIQQRLGLPFEAKVAMAKNRIREWYEAHGGSVYVSFSGGKDSVVLLHLVRSIYPGVPAVFCDTGNEYPEIRDFVRKFEDVTWVTPRKRLHDVIQEYGYPLISKEVAKQVFEVRHTKSQKLKDRRLSMDSKSSGRLSLKWRFLTEAPYDISDKCCYWLKKEPSARYEKETGRKPFVGTTVGESRLRYQQYARHGCNTFEGGRIASKPLSIWSEEDIWKYIKDNNLEVCSLYSKGFDRTGCMCCGFGIHQDLGRFDRLKKHNEKVWLFAMDTLGYREVLSHLISRIKK